MSAYGQRFKMWRHVRHFRRQFRFILSGQNQNVIFVSHDGRSQQIFGIDQSFIHPDYGLVSRSTNPCCDPSVIRSDTWNFIRMSKSKQTADYTVDQKILKIPGPKKLVKSNQAISRILFLIFSIKSKFQFQKMENGKYPKNKSAKLN